MSFSKRLRKQMAKIEYAACKDKVDSMLAQDFNPKLIHEKLTEEGRFTMAYPSFTQILRSTASKTQPSKPMRPAAAESKRAIPARPQRVPGIISVDHEPFPDPRNIDPKTLI